MRKLTEAQKQQRAKQRAQAKATNRLLAKWDVVLSGLLGILLLIWLAVYVREAILQGAISSIWFWVGLAGGVGLLVVLVKKLIGSTKVVRK